MATDKRDRRFQMQFEGGWVEIYEIQPSPKRKGYFILAYRKKRARKHISLQHIATIPKMLAMVRKLSSGQYNQSDLRRMIEREKCMSYYA